MAQNDTSTEENRTYTKIMVSSLSACVLRRSSAVHMSIPASDVELPSLSTSACKSMWKKAERLLSTQGSITHTPGIETARMVASESLSRPHLVRQNKDGKFVCDKQCTMWHGRKICSHTVAVAESVGHLPHFLQSLQKSKPEANLTDLILTSRDKKAAGTKSGKPGRKGGSHRWKVAVTTYENRLDAVCDGSETHSPGPQLQSAGHSSDQNPSTSTAKGITNRDRIASLSIA